MDSKLQPQLPPAATVEKSLDEAFAQFDSKRVSGLQLMSSVFAARNIALEAQRTDLAATQGADAPGLAALDAQVQGNGARAAQFAMLATRAATPRPEVSDTEWVLYGDVHRADAAPASGVTIAPYADGERISGLAKTMTDADGRYVLRAPVKVLARLGIVVATKDSESVAAAGTRTAKGSAVPSTLTVAVLDAKGGPLADVPDKFTAEAGFSDYLVVTLPAEKASSDSPANAKKPSGRRTASAGKHASKANAKRSPTERKAGRASSLESTRMSEAELSKILELVLPVENASSDSPVAADEPHGSRTASSKKTKTKAKPRRNAAATTGRAPSLKRAPRSNRKTRGKK
jgi:hypothetical protein